MWSLPDIKAMNERKVNELKDRRKGKEIKSCEHCNKKAEIEFKYFDIFSDTPCYLDLCEDCMGVFEEHGKEGYFYCDRCNKDYISNITWENYFVEDDEGELICLNCKTKDVFSNPVGFEGIKDLDFEQLRKAPHIIGVGNNNMKNQIAKWGWKELGSITADSMSGGLVVSFSNSLGQDDTMEAFKEFVKENGYKEFVVGVDGAYQFAVDITLWGR